MLQPYSFSLDASTPGIDLQETFNTGYDRAGYDYSIDYERPLDLKLDEAEMTWVHRISSEPTDNP